MIAFRNLLIHGYFAIDPVIVWGVVEKNIMPLLKALRVNAESQWGQTRLILISIGTLTKDCQSIDLSTRFMAQ